MDTQTKIPKQPGGSSCSKKALWTWGFTRLQPQDLQQMGAQRHGCRGLPIWDQPCSQALRCGDRRDCRSPHAHLFSPLPHDQCLSGSDGTANGLLARTARLPLSSIAASQSINLSGWRVPGDGFPTNNLPVWQAWEPLGKSSLFLHKTYGPRVRLASVLTDCPVAAGQSLHESPCGSCTKCVEACPAKAISGKPWQPGTPRDELFSAQACSEYMKRQFQHIGRGSSMRHLHPGMPLRQVNHPPAGRRRMVSFTGFSGTPYSIVFRLLLPWKMSFVGAPPPG